MGISDSRHLLLILGNSHVYWLGHFVPNTVLCFGSGPDFQGTNCRIRFGGFRGGSVDSIGRHGQVTRMSSRIVAGLSITYPSKRGFPQRERDKQVCDCCL